MKTLFSLRLPFGVGLEGAILILLLVACSGTRHLPKGEKLYVGAEIKLESKHKISPKIVRTTAEGALRPLPNKAYLGIRPRLWMYQTAGEAPKSKFNKWLKRNGEAPVLLSGIKPKVTAAIIDARLFNIGIFNSNTSFVTNEKNYTAKVIYTSKIDEQYTIKALKTSISDPNIEHTITTDKGKSLVQAGEPYNLEVLKAERIRLDALLKDNGYFYFNPDYLLFKADTSEANHTVSLNLTLKDSVPKAALTVYRIKNVLIDENYSLNKYIAAKQKDTIVYQNTIFLESNSEMRITPKELLRSVYLRKNELFSRRNQNITINRLMLIDNFKFVRVKFAESDTTAIGFLDVTIYLTPMSKHTFRAEMDLVSKSNNYGGPRMNLSFLNRNTFHGAELLKLNLAGMFETQLSGSAKNMYSYSFNPQIDLTFPRFILPFKIARTSSIYVPKTLFSISYNFLKRVGYFDMKTFQFSYGYKWKEDIRKEHELNPINVSFSSITNKSVAFTDLLNSNPFLKKSYEEQFIAGVNYSYTYSEQMLAGKTMYYFFQVTSETAGNAFSLAKRISGEKVTADNPSRIVGSIYSQFAKVSLDGRAYYNFKNKNKLAMRVFAGAAKPYGNSSVLPYSKQFFSGGPNSIRAFQINSVGPGNYHQNAQNQNFLQLGGDVKLEMNAEYRFNIYSYFNGALFVDAGNVWTLKSDPVTIGSSFSFSGIANQLAVGTGIGLRVDLSFFVLRFDLAMPLRKFWLAENERWVTNEINFGSSAWRSQNLVLNVAIGYPF